MNSLLNSGAVQDLYSSTSGFSYILRDNSSYAPTKYKVLMSQEEGNFVKCMKMQYNGHVQFYYMTKGLKPLSSLLGSLDADRLMIVVANLIGNILQVKQNGFLSCCDIDTSYEHIYVDTKTYRVKLVYLPTSLQFFPDTVSFESDIRSNLIRTINTMVNLQTPKTLALVNKLSNALNTIEDLYCSINGKDPMQNHRQTEANTQKSNQDKHLLLVALNSPAYMALEINKDKFVIGKNPKVCDGVVSYSKMVSRIHCRIDIKDRQFSITDLNSSNGSYLNHARLQPQMPYPIQEGDLIRLANCDFQVRFD